MTATLQRRLGAVLAVAVVGAAGIYVGSIQSKSPRREAAPGHLCVHDLSGWKHRSVQRPGAPPTLVLTNFHFGRVDYLNGHTDHRLRWPRGGILISIADLPASRPRSGRAGDISIAPGDFAPFEGVRNLGQRDVNLDGRLLEVWVQARPTTAATIAEANRELASVQACT